MIGAAQSTGKNILIIEDNPGIQDMLKWTLGFRGYSFASAYTTQAAMGLLDEALFDLVVFDLKLANSTLPINTVAAQLMHLDIPIVVYTALTPDEVVEKTQGWTVAGTLMKPCKPTDLLSTIDQILAQRDQLQQQGDSGQ